MQTNNVYYATQPDDVIVYTNGDKARIEFPVDVSDVEREDGNEWLAKTVYTLETFASDGLKERVKKNYDAWLEKAKAEKPQTPDIKTVVEQLQEENDMLTECILEMSEIIYGE